MDHQIGPTYNSQKYAPVIQLIDPKAEKKSDMSMDIAPTLITLYDSVAANGQVPESEGSHRQLSEVEEEDEEEEEEEQCTEAQQKCESCDQEEPITSERGPANSAAAHPRDSEGSAVAAAVDDVTTTQAAQPKCSTVEDNGSGDTGREGCESVAIVSEESRLDSQQQLQQLSANQSFLHNTQLKAPLVLVDSSAADSYLDRTKGEQECSCQNGGDGNTSGSSANMELVTQCGNSSNKAYLNGARDANFNVEHSSRMVSSDGPEDMAIDVDFNSNSNNDCRPRAHSADLLSDNRRWSQRPRPASAEMTVSDYHCDGSPSSSSTGGDNCKDHEVDVEVGGHRPLRQNSSRINPPILVTTTPLMNEAMSPPTSPPTSPPMSPILKRPKINYFEITYLDRIVDEIIETERSYVRDLGDIIEGYRWAMRDSPQIQLSKDKFDSLFCNLEDIHSFNKELLADLEQCDNDPVKLAECFLDVEDVFCIYTRYCTHYPKAVDVLTECMKDPVISNFFKQQQAKLNHGLALGAYLLKPVQRILKYHLLFQDMMKHYKEEHGRDVIARALKSMTNVAWHINDMKRKHEASVHVQEIQSQLHGWQDDLNSYGDLVLEGVMRMHGARGDRFIYLFEKALLIGKKHENTNLISIKTQIKCSNLMLIESIPKEPLGFNVIPFDNADLQYTIIAKSQDQKKQWTHEIKRLILENYESNIPTKVKELLLGTRVANPDPDTENRAPPVAASPQDPNMSRDRKERKSRKKHKRRNSEPMGKLQRGQKQVKAAVENIIIGMKRPDLSKLTNKKSNDLPMDDGTEDSLDEEPSRARKSEPATPIGKGDSSLAPLARPEDLKEELAGRQDSRQDSPPSSFKKLALSKSLGDKKDNNRDSGIGSMNLSEHLKLDSEDKSSADEAKSGDSRAGKKKGGAVRKRDQGGESVEGLDDTEEEEGEQVVKASEGESPDELEALEQLSDDNHLDMELSPQPPRRSLPGPELFKLRRVDFKEYRPLNDRFSKDHDDVWIPRTNRPFARNRSFSHIPTRPQSADVGLHPHFTKLRLSRTRSDDSSLHTWSEIVKSRSDPNITDHKSDLGDSIKSNEDKQNGLGSSASTFETGDGDLSSLSSHENLTDSINMAFQELGAKYAESCQSKRGITIPRLELEGVATQQDDVSVNNSNYENVNLGIEDTKHLSSNEDSTPKDDDLSNESPEEEAIIAHKKKVQRLARKYSRMIKHQTQNTVIVTRKASESSSESEGKKVAWAVTRGQGGTVIKRFELEDPSAHDMQPPSMPLTRSSTKSTDSEDDRSSGSSRGSITRSLQSRKSVRDFVRRYEVCKQVRPEPKVVTPVQDGIKERLRSFQQDTKQPVKSPQHRSSMGFKKLSERRKELEEWVQRPKERSRHNSESRDSTDGSTSDADLSFSFNSYPGSYASSLHSSGRSSPCPEAKAANINAIKDGLMESISRLASSTSVSAEEEEVTPAMFKSIRERFEELEKAAHKPIPKTVADPKGEMMSVSCDDGEDGQAETTEPNEKPQVENVVSFHTLDLDVPFPEVFETPSSEVSNAGVKSSDSLNTHLDALDFSSDNSASDAKQLSSSSDLFFPEFERSNVKSASTTESVSSNTSPCNAIIRKSVTASNTHQVSLEFSLDVPSKKNRESAHPTMLDVLTLYEGLSIDDSQDESTPLKDQDVSFNRSESSESSSYKDAVSDKAAYSSPTSEEYTTAEEH